MAASHSSGSSIARRIRAIAAPLPSMEATPPMPPGSTTMSPFSRDTFSTGRPALTVISWDPVIYSPPMPASVTGRFARRSTSAVTRASASSKPAPNRI